MRGGYALLLQISGRHAINTRNRQFVLPPGPYVYAGSALGPGGIEARIRRHLRLFKHSEATDPYNIKTMAITNRNTVDGGYRWHIDQLLRTATTFTAVYASSGHRTECLLIRYLKERNLLVIVGFGNTDCSSGCGGHLVHLPEGDIEEATEDATEGFRHLGLEPIVGDTYMRKES